MNIIKYITTFLNSVFLLILLLFVLDNFSAFDIKKQAIKSFTYIGVMIVSPLVLVWNLWYFKSRKRKLTSVIFPIFIIIMILIVGYLEILFSSRSWQTERVLYQNKYSSSKKIELQLQDVGALGYNKRTVEVNYLTHWFMLINPIKEDTIKQEKWIKIEN